MDKNAKKRQASRKFIRSKKQGCKAMLRRGT